MTRFLVLPSSVGFLPVLGCCLLLAIAVDSQDTAAAATGTAKPFTSFEEYKTFIAGNWKYCPVGNGFQYSADYKSCQVIRMVCPESSEMFFNNCGCGCYHSTCDDDNSAMCEFGDLPEGGARKEGYEILNVSIGDQTNDNDAQATPENARMNVATVLEQGADNAAAAAAAVVAEAEAEAEAAAAAAVFKAEAAQTETETETETETDDIDGVKCQHDENTPFRDIVNTYPYAMRVTVESVSTESSFYACVDDDQMNTDTTTTATNLLVPTNSDVVAIESRGMRPSMYATGYYTVKLVEIFHDGTQPKLSMNNDNNGFVLFYENDEGNYRKEWDDATQNSDNDSFLIFPVSVPKTKKCHLDDGAYNKNMYYINKCSKGFAYSSLNQDDINYLKTMAKEQPDVATTNANAAAQKNDEDSGSDNFFGSSYFDYKYGMMMSVLMLGSFLF